MNKKEIKTAVEKRVVEEKRLNPPESKTGEEVPIQFVQSCFIANEVGDGTLYAYLNRNCFAFDSISQHWLRFVNPHWVIDRNNQALAMIEQTVVSQYLRLVEDIEQKIAKADKNEIQGLIKKKSSITGRIKKLRSVTGRKNCLLCAGSIKEHLVIEKSQMDQHPLLLPVQNGVVDMRIGELRAGRPEDLLTKASPFEWKGISEPCPEFEKFLKMSLDNQEKYEFLQRVLGYAVTGLSTEAIFVVNVGNHGRNGKDTLFETLFYVLGDLVGPIQSEMLLAGNAMRSSSGPSPDIMGLRGKRIVWASEVGENARFDIGVIKKMTGGGSLTGRAPMDRAETTFLPNHTLFALVNTKPHAPASDSAFFERVKIINWPLSFVSRELTNPWERKADPDLKEKLKAEASGILAWLVQGYLLYARNGLSAPDIIRHDTLDYRSNEDIMADFIEECCELNSLHEEKFSALYTKYKAWWEDVSGNRRALTKKKFGLLLKDKHERMKRGGAITYLGLRLKFQHEI